MQIDPRDPVQLFIICFLAGLVLWAIRNLIVDAYVDARTKADRRIREQQEEDKRKGRLR